MTDREQRQDAVVVTAAKAGIEYRRHFPESEAAQGTLKAPLFRRAAYPAFPAEPISDEQEGAILGVISEIADRNQRILQTGRDDREIVGVFGAQFESGPAVRRHPVTSRCGRRMRQASPRSARNRGRDDRPG